MIDTGYSFCYLGRLQWTIGVVAGTAVLSCAGLNNNLFQNSNLAEDNAGCLCP